MFLLYMPQIESVPAIDSSDHGMFDAHFLRALAQEGMSRWYRRPRIATTTITTVDIRKQIQNKLSTVFGQLPGIKLPQHLAHLILLNGTALHLEMDTLESILIDIRCAMVDVANGVFCVDKTDPLFCQAKLSKVLEKTVGGKRLGSVHTIKANNEERSTARALVGNPNLRTDITRGPLTESLHEAFENLLILDSSHCLELGIELRRRLHQLINGQQEFTPRLRAQCVEVIIDLWNKSQKTESVELIAEEVQKEVGGSDLYGIEPEQMIQEYINPVLHDQDAVRRRLTAFEIATFSHALDANEAASGRSSIVWETVFPNTKIALCDAHNNVLAYLASVAAGRPLAKFRDALGPPPVLTPRAPNASVVQRPAL